jgi:hypothetical protein
MSFPFEVMNALKHAEDVTIVADRAVRPAYSATVSAQEQQARRPARGFQWRSSPKADRFAKEIPI